MTTSVALFGVSGRMGRALLEAMRDEPDLTVSGALASPASKHLGSDAGDLYGGRSLGVIVTSDREEAMAGAEVVIDFTLANSVPDTLRACVTHRCPLVLGTTGLSADALAQLRASATTIPILYAPNMSIGVNVMINLARTAARTLGTNFEADILDVHHRNKVDAPSGQGRRRRRERRSAQERSDRVHLGARGRSRGRTSRDFRGPRRIADPDAPRQRPIDLCARSAACRPVAGRKGAPSLFHG
jgi:4-hydroxy-tetrahydrodipicolinate reductase